MSQPDRYRAADTILDEYLVVQSQLGDEEAFKRLVGRWHAKLLRRAAQVIGDEEAAKDVVQESWVAVMRGLRSLNDPARFRAWVFRIVSNKGRDWVRREDARRRATQRVEARPVSVEPAPPGPIDRVRTGLAELDAGQRCVLTWFYLEEMSVAEIAAALQVPPGTVKSRLFYARQALVSRLEEE